MSPAWVPPYRSLAWARFLGCHPFFEVAPIDFRSLLRLRKSEVLKLTQFAYHELLLTTYFTEFLEFDRRHSQAVIIEG